MTADTATRQHADAGPALPETVDDDRGRRRFRTCVAWGWAATLVPYLYVLWGLWTGVNPFRNVSPANFYDLQARAMLHGSLAVPADRLGVEAFFHGKNAYTYFGVFPSLLRIPVLAVAPSLTGRLTAPSMLLAWLVTGLFSALLLWRIRILLRGNAAMGWGEAISCGVFMAAVCGGSVLTYLAANPWVYDEDLAWSVALTTAALFALLGVLESPSWRRVLLSGVLILCADLNRLTTGWACVIGGVLVAGWFALSPSATANRRWALPALGAALIPLLIGCTVTWLKFGGPFSLPLQDQEWTRINAARRHFLAVNGGKGWSFKFLPTTLWTYLQPFGLRISGIFPFVTTPTSPPQVIGSAVFDQRYVTASIPASMPLLFLLTVWGLITSFRPRAVNRIAVTRPLLIAAGAATGGVILWGYIADRYVADFMPLLILGGAVGLMDIWRRSGRWTRPTRKAMVAAVALLGAFSVLANTGAALASDNEWTDAQAIQFVQAQKDLSITSLAATVKHGSRLPYWAPAGELFDVGNCAGLYLSDGSLFNGSPGQNIQHETWTPLVQRSSFNHMIEFSLREPAADLDRPIPIFRDGQTTVDLERGGFNTVKVVLLHTAAAPAWPGAVSPPILVHPHEDYVLSVMTDPYLQSIRVHQPNVKDNDVRAAVNQAIGSGDLIVYRYQPGPVRDRVLTTHGASSPVEVTSLALPKPAMSLCRSLQ